MLYPRVVFVTIFFIITRRIRIFLFPIFYSHPSEQIDNKLSKKDIATLVPYLYQLEQDTRALNESKGPEVTSFSTFLTAFTKDVTPPEKSFHVFIHKYLQTLYNEIYDGGQGDTQAIFLHPYLHQSVVQAHFQNNKTIWAQFLLFEEFEQTLLASVFFQKPGLKPYSADAGYLQEADCKRFITFFSGINFTPSFMQKTLGYITGPIGIGKTTLGEEISKKLQIPFITEKYLFAVSDFGLRNIEDAYFFQEDNKQKFAEYYKNFSTLFGNENRKLFEYLASPSTTEEPLNLLLPNLKITPKLNQDPHILGFYSLRIQQKFILQNLISLAEARLKLTTTGVNTALLERPPFESCLYLSNPESFRTEAILDKFLKFEKHAMALAHQIVRGFIQKQIKFVITPSTLELVCKQIINRSREYELTKVTGNSRCSQIQANILLKTIPYLQDSTTKYATCYGQNIQPISFTLMAKSILTENLNHRLVFLAKNSTP
jgi:hypothetical protein